MLAVRALALPAGAADGRCELVASPTGGPPELAVLVGLAGVFVAATGLLAPRSRRRI
jgi:hypothetical protein